MKILKYNGKLLFKLFTKVIIYIGMSEIEVDDFFITAYKL